MYSRQPSCWSLWGSCWEGRCGQRIGEVLTMSYDTCYTYTALSRKLVTLAHDIDGAAWFCTDSVQSDLSPDSVCIHPSYQIVVVWFSDNIAITVTFGEWLQAAFPHFSSGWDQTWLMKHLNRQRVKQIYVLWSCVDLLTIPDPGYC